MKVILLEDVKSLGKKGEIVSVNEGYASNYILPMKLGFEATGKNMNDLKLQKSNQAARKLAGELEKGQIELAIKVGEGGKSFGSISGKEIAVAVKEQMDLEVDKKKIQLKEAVKTLGEHMVPIKLHSQVTARLKLIVKEEA